MSIADVIGFTVCLLAMASVVAGVVAGLVMERPSRRITEESETNR